eukprot:g18074.t1
MDEDNYDDEQFEEDEAHQPSLPEGTSEGEIDKTPQQFDVCSWKAISYDELELGEQLGGGSMGLVYRGTYKQRPVAVKTLFNRRIDEALTREYVDELLILSQLHHPNIVHFHGAGVPPSLFYVMELCERSLFDLLHVCRRALNTRQRVAMALDVSKAMGYLHSRSPPVLHRDLKSLNLLVVKEDGPVKLCDFGLVRTTVTSAGTPAYMAPELLEDRPFSKSVDLYAFGILLWEIFSRDIPFAGFSAADVREAVVSGGRPRVPTGNPSQVGQLMCRCWCQDPRQRPPFNEVEDLLQALLESTPTTTELEGMESGDCLDDLCGK